jgi:hypothetical protein
LAIGLKTNGTHAEANLSDRTADDWIQQWKKESLVNKDLQGQLDLRRFKDPMYILLGSIGWKPKMVPSVLSAVVVPAGFVTDFASVPRAFWSLFRPDGNYAYAAVLHDYLYWTQDRPKSAADAIFRAAMDDLKIADSQSAILFHAVDLFGSSAWDSKRCSQGGWGKTSVIENTRQFRSYLGRMEIPSRGFRPLRVRRHGRPTF